MTASSIISDVEKWNGPGSMNSDQRREVDAADAGAGGADREREQRVRRDIDAKTLGADRIVAQRAKARPRRAQRATTGTTPAG
jgi:hypothetical protein